MDVDRLMRDLTVEELENIQTNLEKEMEGKRESLREMVGRRYRDVLEASSEVRNVFLLAEKLAQDVANTRTTQQPPHIRSRTRDEQRACERFFAVHYLLANIADEENDALNDALGMLLVEFLHKQLVTHTSTSTMYRVACSLTNRIVSTRSELEADLTEGLLDIARPDWAANQLAAIAVLQARDVEFLLDVYLSKRFEYVSQLIEDSSSLLNVIEEIKKTMAVVEELFVNGELQHVIQSFCNGQYRSELIDRMCSDQAFFFERLIMEDVEKVIRVARERKIATNLPMQAIHSKCSDWIEKVCAAARHVVAEVCEYYEDVEQVIELLQAIATSLKKDWPRIGPSNKVYEQLLQQIVLDKLKSLVKNWTENVESDVRRRVGDVSVAAPTSIFEERSYRLNSSAHNGVSSALVGCVRHLWAELEKVFEKCQQYEAICTEMNDTRSASDMRSTLSALVHALLLRLCEGDAAATSPAASVELSRARLALAVVHSDASLVCSLLDKDAVRISSLNQRLHAVVERSLLDYCTSVVNECITTTSLGEYLDAFQSSLHSLRLLQEWQSVEMGEVGVVDVPITMSATLYAVLFHVACRVNEASVAHLLNKNIRRGVSGEIASRFAEILSTKVTSSEGAWHLPDRSTTQVLFDVRVLNAMFPSEKLKTVCHLVESHMDPFDISLLSPLIAQNVQFACARSQVIFASLLVDVVSTKDMELPQSYSKVQDVVVRIDQPSRIPMIPRLDRAAIPTELKRAHASRQPKENKLLSNPQNSSKSTPSLSAFYDRISSSWFGANN